MQLYQRKPAGIKPLYSRGMVELSLELHIPPHYLYEQMFCLRRAATPRLGRLWATYGDNPRRLSRDVKVLRSMAGFSNAALFYDGVAMHESFERDFRPMPSCGQLMPMMLIIILDQYFRLTPATMVRNTPEIADLSKLMGIKADVVVEVMETFSDLRLISTAARPSRRRSQTSAAACGSATATATPKSCRRWQRS